MPMTEAHIVIPHADNEGQTIRHATIQRNLLNVFGGYSATTIAGAWKDPETSKVYRDTSTRYTIAGDWTKAGNVETLQAFAQWAAEYAKQICIYLCVNGEVSFIEPVHAPAIAA